MLKRNKISKTFLYRYRFQIGYVLLALTFFVIVFSLPFLSPAGIAKNEMESVVAANELSLNGVLYGNIINLPYRALQKLMVMVFGLNMYAIKLPSIIFASILAIFLILLLNRWFKNNVALISSALVVLSVPFLFMAGNGGPEVMFVLYPVILLWLGSKIHKNPKPKAIWFVWFSLILALATLTPQLGFFTAAIILYAMINPHIRFSFARMPIWAKILTLVNLGIIVAEVVVLWTMNRSGLWYLIFYQTQNIGEFFANIGDGILLFFTWNSVRDSSLLSPLIGLPVFAVMVVGLIANMKKFFQSRLFLAFGMTLFTLLTTGFYEKNAILIVVPVAVLTAYGVEYIFRRWYGIFPENPYARLFALIPITIFLSTTVSGNFLHYVYGYKYVPIVANYFNNDLDLIKDKIASNTQFLMEETSLEYKFFKILNKKYPKKIITNLSEVEGDKKIAILKNHKKTIGSELELIEIITSPKLIDSDRIYIYTVKN